MSNEEKILQQLAENKERIIQLQNKIDSLLAEKATGKENIGSVSTHSTSQSLSEESRRKLLSNRRKILLK